LLGLVAAPLDATAANQESGQLLRAFPKRPRRFSTFLLCGVAVLALSACASNRTPSATRSPDFSGLTAAEAHSALGSLAARYKSNPRDKSTIIFSAAALRANGQPEQAVAVAEAGMKGYARDAEVRIAYAKALTAAGRFQQAMTVIDDTINPAQPDWNALSVKGAILDQMGRNGEARALYKQALTIAPHEASLHANLGLSYAMTNDLNEAETHLRTAVKMRGATSQTRQNLALIVGLQGRFDECRAMFAAELEPQQVEANMAYIRALLTQQNRWETIKASSE
jgi:Flp pilus assembly protein TadD